MASSLVERFAAVLAGEERFLPANLRGHSAGDKMAMEANFAGLDESKQAQILSQIEAVVAANRAAATTEAATGGGPTSTHATAAATPGTRGTPQRRGGREKKKATPTQVARQRLREAMARTTSIIFFVSALTGHKIKSKHLAAALQKMVQDRWPRASPKFAQGPEVWMSETTDSDFMAVLDDGKFAKAIAKLPDYRGDAVALLVEAHALLADAVAMEHGANMTRDQLKARVEFLRNSGKRQATAAAVSSTSDMDGSPLLVPIATSATTNGTAALPPPGADASGATGGDGMAEPLIRAPTGFLGEVAGELASVAASSAHTPDPFGREMPRSSIVALRMLDAVEKTISELIRNGTQPALEEAERLRSRHADLQAAHTQLCAAEQRALFPEAAANLEASAASIETGAGASDAAHTAPERPVTLADIFAASATAAGSGSAPAVAAAASAVPLLALGEVLALVERPTMRDMSAAEKASVWEYRQHLRTVPHALRWVLLATNWASAARLRDIQLALQGWSVSGVTEVLSLLAADVPGRCLDAEARTFLPAATAREFAVTMHAVHTFIMSLMARAPLADLALCLPQLLLTLRWEREEELRLAGSYAMFFLGCARTDTAFAFRLYWVLTGHGAEAPEACAAQWEWLRAALLSAVDDDLRQDLADQTTLVSLLDDTAASVAAAADDPALLDAIGSDLVDRFECGGRPFHLPANPNVVVSALTGCTVSDSNAHPMILTFESLDGGVERVVYKTGDDCRHDELCLQAVSLLARLFDAAAGDMGMVTYSVCVTGARRGMIHCVPDTTALADIHMRKGLITGVFSKMPLLEHLQRLHPDAEDMVAVAETFRSSCAGYSVCMHVLGVGDRHNDNVLIVDGTGSLLHIDYGKILGEWERVLGVVRRDRAPMLLTPDLVEVIAAALPDDPLASFEVFRALVAACFEVVLRHGPALVSIFNAALPIGIPAVTPETIGYVEAVIARLKEGCDGGNDGGRPVPASTSATSAGGAAGGSTTGGSNVAALDADALAAVVDDLIDESLSASNANRLNFFAHNFAHRKRRTGSSE